MATRTILECVGTLGTIAGRDDLMLLTDSQDVSQVKADYGIRDTSIGGAFVATANGDYTEVYLYDGIVPILYKPLYKAIRVEE